MYNNLNYYKINPRLNYQSIQNTYKLYLRNDSINILHVLYPDLQKSIHHNMTYFVQCGIQNLLSNQAVCIGGGKRYNFNNHSFAGYNILLHIPCNYKINQPYSMNAGVEYKYNQLILLAKHYYNLNQILHINTQKNFYYSQYPDIGYQLCIQTQLPYIPECIGQIKWIHSSYNKKNKKLYENIDFLKNSVSISINYYPIPILGFNIDNIFAYNQYINTLFNIIINYQFHIPITQQIKPYFYDPKQETLILKKNNSYSAIDAFIPITDIKTNHTHIPEINSIEELYGYPGETKFFKTNNQKNFQLNIKQLQQVGGKIWCVKKNIYVIRFPNRLTSNDNKILLTYNEQKHSNIKNNTQNIYIVIKNFDTSHNTSNTLPDYNTSDITDITHNNQEQFSCSYYNDPPVVSPDITQHNNNNQKNQNSLLFNNNQQIKEYENTDSQKNADNNFPPPPPLTELFVSLQEPSSSKQISKSHDQLNTSGMPHHDIKKHEYTSDYSLHSVSNPNLNELDLSAQLNMHRNTKFSSIDDQDYVKKLEQDIINRKKNKCTSNMEKMLQKLNIALSMSSIDESLKTDDSDNSF